MSEQKPAARRRPASVAQVSVPVTSLYWHSCPQVRRIVAMMEGMQELDRHELAGMCVGLLYRRQQSEAAEKRAATVISLQARTQSTGQPGREARHV